MDLNEMNPVLLIATLTQQIVEQEKIAEARISEMQKTRLP